MIEMKVFKTKSCCATPWEKNVQEVSNQTVLTYDLVIATTVPSSHAVDNYRNQRYMSQFSLSLPMHALLPLLDPGADPTLRTHQP